MVAEFEWTTTLPHSTTLCFSYGVLLYTTGQFNIYAQNHLRGSSMSCALLVSANADTTAV